jgi:putative oxidoreductase
MERVNDTFLLIGRLLMAALFLVSGVPKLLGLISRDGAFGGSYAGFLQAVTNSGLPYPEVWALVGVAIEVLVPIALILGVFPRISALLLIAFVVVATALAHRFWQFPDAAAYRGQLNHFLKNIAIIGGMLYYFVTGPGAFSLAGRSVGSGAAVPARA